VITAEFGGARSYEVDLEIKHLEKENNTEDLLLFDRNYASYDFMRTLIEKGINASTTLRQAQGESQRTVL
jgi:hypothetical protein